MPTAHTSQTPVSGDVANGAAITTGVRFTVADAAPISGIALWVPATNTGTYTAGLWQSTSDDDPGGTGTGTELRTASVNAAALTAGGWDYIPITPFTPSTGVVYTAGVHSSSGRIVATSGGLSSAITAGGVTLLAAGSDPNPPGLGSLANGVFVEGGALAYPNSSFGSSDYFIDVIRGNTVVGTASATLGALAATATGLRTVVGVVAATLGGLAVSATGATNAAPRTLLAEGPRRKGVTPLDSTRGTPSMRPRRR